MLARAVLCAAVLLVSVLAAGSSSASSTAPVYAPLKAQPPQTNITHVVLIAFENEELSDVKQYAPYQYSLAQKYGEATNYYAACHESLPDYEAWTDGRATGCTNFGVQSVENLGDLLTAKNLTWAGYFESMPQASGCDTTDSGANASYNILHNPWIHYKDIVKNSSVCHAHLFNSAAFNESLFVNGTLPSFSMYIPNQYNDGHSIQASKCGIPHAKIRAIELCQADTWTKNFFTQVFNPTPTDKTVLAHTAFILVYDEGASNLGYSLPGITNPQCEKKQHNNMTACGGHTFLAIIDPYDTHHLNYTANATDYNVESTIEWLFNLPSDGGYDGTSQFPAMTNLFPIV